MKKSLHLASSDDKRKYLVNKRKHEIIHMVKDLFNLCKYYHCEIFAVEQLNIKASDKGFGREINRLTNNVWYRNLTVKQIRKYIDASSTVLVGCQPQYTSYIGNLVFRQEHLPDECLASIEIGRRGFEFATQYIFKRRLQQKTVIRPSLEIFKSQLIQSLEELKIDVPGYDSWPDIQSAAKKSKEKYRFSSSDSKKCTQKVFLANFINKNIYA